MQDKIIGIAVFLVVGILMVGFGSPDTDWLATAKGALTTPKTWAAAIVALAVARMAMGVYTGGGLNADDVKGAILLVLLASMVGGTFPMDNWGAWLGTAWILTGGLRI